MNIVAIIIPNKYGDRQLLEAEHCGAFHLSLRLVSMNIVAIIIPNKDGDRQLLEAEHCLVSTALQASLCAFSAFSVLKLRSLLLFRNKRISPTKLDCHTGKAKVGLIAMTLYQEPFTPPASLYPAKVHSNPWYLCAILHPIE